MFLPLRQISPQLSGPVRAARNFLNPHYGLVICGIFLLAGWLLADDYGCCQLDEPDQKAIAQANLDYVLGRTDNIAADPYHNRVYGAVFELPLLLAEQALRPMDSLTTSPIRFFLTHLFFILGGWFCYRLTWRLFNNRLLALGALLFFLLHPRIYAHSFFNSKDPVFLSMLMIALYLLERAFRRDTWAAFALLGIAVGLLTNLRIMGLMLFPAVLAMRGLDLFQAGNWPGRKHILLTGGLFTLAAGLTLYAAAPYAWLNPGDYLLTSLTLTVEHPVLVPQLFQGQWVYARELPHYNALWFSIATPPLMLLLGFIGIAAVLMQSLAQPGALFRNTRLRFLALLLACFLLPPLAATLLGSNQQDDWRHFYFLYAPFCLLAAAGLHWIVCSTKILSLSLSLPILRAGGYGLAGAGLGLLALQMAQIHPFQDLYFNFLADRTAPEHLRTQYPMVPFNGERPELPLAYLRESYPGETPAIRAGFLAYQDFAEADYAVFLVGPGNPDLAFNSLPVGRIYNNTILAVKPLTAARMTAAASAAYREIYRAAVAGEPIIRAAAFDVYFQDRTLTFIRENCPWGDRERRVYVKIFRPRATGDGPTLFLRSHGVRLGDTCLAVIQLPAYAQGDLIIGQDAAESNDWRDLVYLRRPIPSVGGHYWEELYSLAQPGLRERIAAARRENRQPSLRQDFEVFLGQDSAGRNWLLYAKDGCSAAEYETLVALHIYPANPADWPAAKEIRDFHLTRYGGRPGGDCLAAVPLPAWPGGIKEIYTGQAGVWGGSLFPPKDPEPLRAAYAALAAVQPDRQADFDLYWRDGYLTYIRESCAAADTDAPFFLHLFPASADWHDGSASEPENRDFDFGRWGGPFDGKCLAAVPLPDYPIAEMRTGQYLPGQGNLWSAKLFAPVDPDELRATYAALAGAEPVARADFDLYVLDNRLIYLRENCAAADTAGRFFLHLFPADADLLDWPPVAPENRDFDFARWGGNFDGKCLAAVPLPDYPIAEMRTGQYGPGQ